MLPLFKQKTLGLCGQIKRYVYWITPCLVLLCTLYSTADEGANKINFSKKFLFCLHIFFAHLMWVGVRLVFDVFPWAAFKELFIFLCRDKGALFCNGYAAFVTAFRSK